MLNPETTVMIYGTEEEMWLLMIQGGNVWRKDMETFARQLACLLGARSRSKWPRHCFPSETDCTATLCWYVSFVNVLMSTTWSSKVYSSLITTTLTVVFQVNLG